MFWICDQNSANNIGMFQVSLSSTHTATPPARRLGVRRGLGGDTAGTADPS